jgi:hypothetical protein
MRGRASVTGRRVPAPRRTSREGVLVATLALLLLAALVVAWLAAKTA